MPPDQPQIAGTYASYWTEGPPPEGGWGLSSPARFGTAFPRTISHEELLSVPDNVTHQRVALANIARSIGGLDVIRFSNNAVADYFRMTVFFGCLLNSLNSRPELLIGLTAPMRVLILRQLMQDVPMVSKAFLLAHKTRNFLDRYGHQGVIQHLADVMGMLSVVESDFSEFVLEVDLIRLDGLHEWERLSATQPPAQELPPTRDPAPTYPAQEPTQRFTQRTAVEEDLTLRRVDYPRATPVTISNLRVFNVQADGSRTEQAIPVPIPPSITPADDTNF